MPTLQKFNDFAEQVLRGVHNFGAHTFKVALTNMAPAATNTVLADIAQIAASGGYVAGGYVLDSAVLSETAGTAKVVFADEEIVASGGAIGPFKYGVIYNDSAAGKPLVGFVERPDNVTLQDGDKVSLDIDPALGVLTLT